jgi:NAD(P)-dependent dehydrogenase (short-subunit alcohol dehydrogenase family)
MAMTRAPIIVATGLSSAIGQALYPLVAGRGRILALGRRSIQAPGVDFLLADFRAPRERWVSSLSQRLQDWGAPVQGFVHVAGVVYSDRLEATTASEWQDTLAVNVTAAHDLAQVLSPYWGPGASAVLVGSVDAWLASETGPAAAYGASKAALGGLVRHWAAEWGGRGIRVNGVFPGALTTGNGPSDPKTAEGITARIALGRLGHPGEVAQVIAFLLSEQASYITGAIIPVDGGLNLRY